MPKGLRVRVPPRAPLDHGIGPVDCLSASHLLFLLDYILSMTIKPALASIACIALLAGCAAPVQEAPVISRAAPPANYQKSITNYFDLTIKGPQKNRELDIGKPEPGGCLLADRIAWEPRLPLPGALARPLFAAFFRHRHRRLRRRFGKRGSRWRDFTFERRLGLGGRERLEHRLGLTLFRLGDRLEVEQLVVVPRLRRRRRGRVASPVGVAPASESTHPPPPR